MGCFMEERNFWNGSKTFVLVFCMYKIFVDLLHISSYAKLLYKSTLIIIIIIDIFTTFSNKIKGNVVHMFTATINDMVFMCTQRLFLYEYPFLFCITLDKGLEVKIRESSLLRG